MKKVIEDERKIAQFLSGVLGNSISPKALKGATLEMRLTFGNSSDATTKKMKEIPIMVPAPSMKGCEDNWYTRYTEEEEEQLIDLVENSSMTYKEIAQIMRRSYNGIAAKINALQEAGKIAPRRERYFPISKKEGYKIYTDKDMEILMDQSLSAKEVSKILKRTISSVVTKRSKLLNNK